MYCPLLAGLGSIICCLGLAEQAIMASQIICLCMRKYLLVVTEASALLAYNLRSASQKSVREDLIAFRQDGFWRV